jgi:hypothetical protein
MGLDAIKKLKRDMTVSKPAYIEYRQAHTVRPAPPIFIGEATTSTNIGHAYSSVTWPHQRIYESSQSQTEWLIYSLVPSQNR